MHAAIKTLNIYPREIKIHKTKDLSKMFTALLTATVKSWKQPKCLSRGKCIHKL